MRNKIFDYSIGIGQGSRINWQTGSSFLNVDAAFMVKSYFRFVSWYNFLDQCQSCGVFVRISPETGIFPDLYYNLYITALALVKEVVSTDKPEVAFKDVDAASGLSVDTTSLTLTFLVRI